MARVGMDFVTSIRETGSTYYVEAKGNVKALLDAIEVMVILGSLNQQRAEVLKKFLPVEKGWFYHSVELSPEQAQTLQRFLVGWGGSLQRMLQEYAKRGQVKLPYGEVVETSGWNNIQVDVSVSDPRQSTWWGQLTSAMPGVNAITMSEAEWQAIYGGLSVVGVYKEIGQQVGMVAREVTRPSIQEAKAQMGQVMDQKIQQVEAKVKKASEDAGQSFKKTTRYVAIGGGVVLTLLAGTWWLARKPVQAKQSSETTGRG